MRLPIWLASLSLALSLPIAAADSTVYRWKDASGQTHFTQTPPPSGSYDVMRGMHASPSAPAPAANADAAGAAADQRSREQRFIEQAEAARKAKAEAKEKERVAKAEKEQRCKAAQEAAQFLEERTARRLVTMADDGNYARMDEDDFLKRLDAAKKDVATYCG
jgi:ATPase subunit of ABC transporter with duplicated ATPase domains